MIPLHQQSSAPTRETLSSSRQMGLQTGAKTVDTVCAKSDDGGHATTEAGKPGQLGGVNGLPVGWSRFRVAGSANRSSPSRHGWTARDPTSPGYVLDGDDLVFNTGSGTGNGRALAREGRASLVVDEQIPPYSFVKVDGTISLSDDRDEVRRFAALIGGRYMGADRAEEYGERNGVPGDLLVRLHPTKVTAGFDIAD